MWFYGDLILLRGGESACKVSTKAPSPREHWLVYCMRSEACLSINYLFIYSFILQLSGIKKLEPRLNMILFKMKFPEEMQDVKPVSSWLN